MSLAHTLAAAALAFLAAGVLAAFWGVCATLVLDFLKDEADAAGRRLGALDAIKLAVAPLYLAQLLSLPTAEDD